MEFKYNDSLVSEGDIRSTAEHIAPYLKHLSEMVTVRDFEKPESSLCLLDGTYMADKVKEIAESKVGPRLKYVFLIGIGGASLGAKAIYESMFYHADLFDARKRLPEAERVPRMFFLDNVGSVQTQESQAFIESNVDAPEEMLVIIASKSGATVETALNAEMALSALSRKFGKEAAVARTVAITEEGSPLWKAADRLHMSMITVQHHIGDRFSVFSPMGLFPLQAVGFDIDLIRKRAHEMELKCLSSDPNENPAIVSAAIMKRLYDDEKRSIHDLSVFRTQLESLGKWHRQLLAESLGKRENQEFEIVHAGITPTVSVGTTDMHSMLQLSLGGPRDKITTFVFLEASDDRTVPAEQTLGLVPVLSKKSSYNVLSAIYQGVKASYREEKLPFMEVVLKDVHDIPAFMQFKMIETMLLGRLLDINPFNQPNVEAYKAETRKILESL